MGTVDEMLRTIKAESRLTQGFTDRTALLKLNYHNVELRQGDGHRGWPEHAPFDGIIVAATAPRVPPALKEQLKPGGRIVIPVGDTDISQTLIVLKKDENGKFTTHNILPVAFVPLTGKE